MFVVAMIRTDGTPTIGSTLFYTVEAAHSHAFILNQKAWRKNHDLKARPVPIPTRLSKIPR